VNDGTISDVGFVFFDAKVVDSTMATGFIVPHALPCLFAVNISRTVTVIDTDRPLGSLIDNTPLNDSGGFNVVETDGSNGSVGSLDQ
jgi:hypothetical protein